MNAPHKSAPHPSHEGNPSHERTPTQPQRDAQPQRDDANKHAGQSTPEKPDRQAKHGDDRDTPRNK
jgi:hypothetical protein